MTASEIERTLETTPALRALLVALELLPTDHPIGSSPWVDAQLIVEAWVKNDAREYVCARCGIRDDSHCEKSDAEF